MWKVFGSLISNRDDLRSCSRLENFPVRYDLVWRLYAKATQLHRRSDPFLTGASARNAMLGIKLELFLIIYASSSIQDTNPINGAELPAIGCRWAPQKATFDESECSAFPGRRRISGPKTIAGQRLPCVLTIAFARGHARSVCEVAGRRV